MKYTQNKKILQITDQILIIGVDVASETHYSRALTTVESSLVKY